VIFAWWLGCGPEAPPVGGDAAEGVVMTTLAADYTVGSISVVDPDLGVHPDLASVHGDAVVRVDGGAVWLINRYLVDTVRRYAPGAWAAPVWEVSAGVASNPHAVALCGGALWVTRYEEATLWALDPETGERLREVDLSAWADDDGVPEASDLVVDGETVWVGLQRLRRRDGWVAEAQGTALRLDCATGEVVDEVATGPNPVLRAGRTPGEVMVIDADGVGPIGGPRWDVEPGVVDGAFGARSALIRRDDDVHTVLCVGDAVASLAPMENYLSGLTLDGQGRALVAVRPGWRDPEAPSGALVVDLAACAAGELLATPLPPFSLAALPTPAEAAE
jgi:hypothetical protein